MKNKKAVKLLSLTFLMAIILVVSSVTVIAKQTDKDDSFEDGILFLNSLMKYVDHNYYGEIDKEKLIEGACKGVFEELDKHSQFFDKKEFGGFSRDTSGEFGGIGVVVSTIDGYLTVQTTVDSGPSARAGIRAKDKIVSVDDVNIVGKNIYEALELIKGEIGTNVKIGVTREGQSNTIYYNLERILIKDNPITYKIIKDDIGYIKLTGFNGHSNEEMDKALESMDKKDIKKIIVDLRNNGGGSLDQVVRILNNFVPEGPVVHIKYSDGTEKDKYSFLDEKMYDLVVLVNGGSASASEIFSGAVQDTKSGTIIGQKTYGKGSVQEVIPLTSGMGFKLTIANYFTPNNNKVDGVGITPDIEVKNIFQQLEEKVEVSLLDRLDGTKSFKKGDVGLEVLIIEQILDFMKYDIKSADGVMDRDTTKAIIEFQKDNKLIGDGVVGKKTQSKLKESLVDFVNSESMDMELNEAIKLLSK